MTRRDPKQEKRFAKYAGVLGLTIQEAEELCQAASATWQYIGYDCLSAVPGEEMDQDEVVEVVLDADHITLNNRLSPKVKESLRKYDEIARITRIKLLKEFVFPFKHYGM